MVAKDLHILGRNELKHVSIVGDPQRAEFFDRRRLFFVDENDSPTSLV